MSKTELARVVFHAKDHHNPKLGSIPTVLPLENGSTFGGGSKFKSAAWHPDANALVLEFTDKTGKDMTMVMPFSNVKDAILK